MTEVEARIAILEQRKRLSGKDAAVDALIEKLTKPQGRDLYLARLERVMDGEPEEDPEEDPRRGRDRWVERLPKMCDEFNREYQHNLKVHRTMAWSVLKER